jgi:hypothetical protein
VHAFRREMLARGLHVLGCDPQPRALAYRLLIVVILAHRHHHPAARDLQVDRLVQPLAAVLVEHVLARDAQVGRAVLHVGRYVCRPDDDDPHVAAVGRQDQLPRSLGIFARRHACCGEERHGFIENAALGERDRDHGTGRQEMRGSGAERIEL